MNALRTVPGHNDDINVHELKQIVKGLKNNKADGNDGIPSKAAVPNRWVATHTWVAKQFRGGRRDFQFF